MASVEELEKFAKKCNISAEDLNALKFPFRVKVTIKFMKSMVSGSNLRKIVFDMEAVSYTQALFIKCKLIEGLGDLINGKIDSLAYISIDDPDHELLLPVVLEGKNFTVMTIKKISIDIEYAKIYFRRNFQQQFPWDIPQCNEIKNEIKMAPQSVNIIMKPDYYGTLGNVIDTHKYLEKKYGAFKYIFIVLWFDIKRISNEPEYPVRGCPVLVCSDSIPKESLKDVLGSNYIYLPDFIGYHLPVGDEENDEN